MEDDIYRDSLGAWQGLSEIGGLELDGRDKDLATQLKSQINPNAPDLETALASTPIDEFLQTLFQVVQPFALMFRDVLNFFEKAGAREGQKQWKISVGDEFVDLQHFEEFLEHWNNIECDIEIPAIDRGSAFIPNNVRLELGGFQYLRENEFGDGSISTGIADVDAWLAEYDNGRYSPFPESLHPDKLGPGLDDAAWIVIAALSVLRRRSLDREEMLSEHRARSFKSDERDALHPWTIAQNETDYWLRSCVQYLAELSIRSDEERKAFGAKLVSAYANFPRRRMSASIQIKDLERLLSLPAWKKRYEFYGVWVATEIVGALEDHDIVINHTDGVLKFAFAETRIAEVKTARPKMSLFSERRTTLSDPVGKSRVSSVQPDFGIWARGSQPDKCVMIIEVKHYKKRSRRNFRDSLIDYATAHPKAMVILVNYGPVGFDFTDLPRSINDRCMMIGYLNHEDKLARDRFRDIVRTSVGDPVASTYNVEVFESDELIVLDTSKSMSNILEGDWFTKFIDNFENTPVNVALVDEEIRSLADISGVVDWLSHNMLGDSTSLSAPISDLLREYERLIVVTDSGGLNSLRDLAAVITELDVEDEKDLKLLRISRPSIQ